jgi:hypothetical protein
LAFQTGLILILTLDDGLQSFDITTTTMDEVKHSFIENMKHKFEQVHGFMPSEEDSTLLISLSKGPEGEIPSILMQKTLSDIIEHHQIQPPSKNKSSPSMFLKLSIPDKADKDPSPKAEAKDHYPFFMPNEAMRAASSPLADLPSITDSMYDIQGDDWLIALANKYPDNTAYSPDNAISEHSIDQGQVQYQEPDTAVNVAENTDVSIGQGSGIHNKRRCTSDTEQTETRSKRPIRNTRVPTRYTSDNE